MMKRMFGLFLILGGMACFLYPSLRDFQTQKEVDRIVRELDVGNEEEKEKGAADPGKGEKEPGEWKIYYEDLYLEFQQYNESLLLGQTITDAWGEGDQEVPEVRLDGQDAGLIGAIEIPDMKTRLPLYIGATKENLAKGAAVMAQTSMPVGGENTNCVGAGHRGWKGSAYFQYIENMQPGSRVYLKTPWWDLTYEAVGFDVVAPEDVDSIRIREGKDMLTLVSCHPYRVGGGAPNRYLVFCERVPGDPSENAALSSGREGTGKEPDELMPRGNASGEEKEEQGLIHVERVLRIALPCITIIAGLLLCIRAWRKR